MKNLVTFKNQLEETYCKYPGVILESTESLIIWDHILLDSLLQYEDDTPKPLTGPTDWHKSVCQCGLYGL